ncbi:MAG: hypothetical protein FWF53_03105 [Candidatus Azobacteroides sp.]|nr:hypothetical protein [Candidatus Azobacteroides sp.]
MLPLANVIVKFILEGETFEAEHFDINFKQPVNRNGQPQSEMKGGQINLFLTQAATNNLYLWAKKSTLLKDGKVLFQTDMGMTVLEVEFINAYCVSLVRRVNAYAGTGTVLAVTPERVKLNGRELNNKWRN